MKEILILFMIVAFLQSQYYLTFYVHVIKQVMRC